MKREELKQYTSSEIEEIDDALLEASEDGIIKMTRAYIASEADNVMDTMEARIKELEDKNRHLGIIAMLDGDMLKMAERIRNLEAQLENVQSSMYAENVDANMALVKANERIKELEAENARLKATISKMENVDERREYAYEMDIVIRWLDKNEDFVTEPNGKMQLLKSKAMHQKIKWLDEHPRVPTTE